MCPEFPARPRLEPGVGSAEKQASAPARSPGPRTVAPAGRPESRESDPSVPTPERPSHRNPGGERDYLSLLGGFVAARLVLLAVLYGAATWKEVRADQANQLDTALILSQKALDRFFVESQAQLRELSLDLEEDGGLDNLVVARGLLKRYAALHADAVAITLMRPDGQVIATSTLDGAPPEGFPSMATYPSYQAFLYELGAGRDMSLGGRWCRSRATGGCSRCATRCAMPRASSRR